MSTTSLSAGKGSFSVQRSKCILAAYMEFIHSYKLITKSQMGQKELP